MTTTDTLRRAAALMRERAQAATPGPWRYVGYVSEQANPGDGGGWVHAGIGASEHAVAVTLPYSSRANEDAYHLASWHPAVALAVADLLEAEASIQSLYPDRDDDDIANALAVAAAYLGEPSS